MIIMKQLHSEWGNVGSWGIGASRATPTANVLASANKVLKII